MQLMSLYRKNDIFISDKRVASERKKTTTHEYAKKNCHIGTSLQSV